MVYTSYMLFQTKQHFWQLTAVLLTMIFILVSVFGLFCVGMNLSMGMSDCPLLMGAREAMCPMKMLSHISAWQKLFTAIPASNALLLFVVLVGVVSFYIFQIKRCDESPPSAWNRWHLYQTNHRNLRLYNFWLAVLARGIVQPKLFA